MRNDKIGEMLRLYRKQHKLSVTDVCVRLQEDYDIHVAEKTVYGWEGNQAHPTADTFVAMCELYQVDNIKSLYGETIIADDTMLLTDEEKELVIGYRKNPLYQPAVRKLLNMSGGKKAKNV